MNGIVGGGGYQVSSWSASSSRNWASLLGEGVCGVGRGALRLRNVCLGQVRRGGGHHVVGVKAWLGHAAWGEGECVGFESEMVVQPFQKVRETVRSKVGVLAGRLMGLCGC